MRNNMMQDESFSMTGLWFNPRTGDSFEVRDCFYDESNKPFVIAKDGRTFHPEDIEAYIQAEHPEDIQMLKNQMQQKKAMQRAAPSRPRNEQLPPEVQSILQNEFSDDDPGLKPVTRPLKNTVTPDTVVEPKPRMQPQQPAPAPAPFIDEDTLVVSRMLSRAAYPEITCSIKWSKKPLKQVEMLCDYMCIDPELIVEHYIKSIKIDELVAAVSAEIKSELMKMLDNDCDGAQHASQPEQAQPEPAPAKRVSLPKPKHPVKKK